MKKQFFYAAFAIAMMASCTSENEPVVDQPTPDAEDKVAIELGVNTPNIVGSRGTGTVGNVEGETDATTWNNQSLNIIMVNRSTGDYATEDNSPCASDLSNYILNGLTFRAPKADAGDGNIRIYSNEASNTLKFKYYPVNGKFDFYGYHIDGITGSNQTITPDASNPTNAVAKVENIVFDGSQDILAGKAIQIPATAPTIQDEPGYEYTQQSLVSGVDWNAMNANQFSAKTARNGFIPILDFKHQLARLKFYVKSGNAENGAQYKWDETTSNWVKRNNATLAGYTEYLDGAIYIKGITAMDLHDVIDIDLKTSTASLNAASNGEADFVLRSLPESTATDKNLVTLIPVAPMFPLNAASATSGDIDQTGAAIGETIEYTDKTPVGESIMFFPSGTSESEIVLKLDLIQIVPDTMTEGDESSKTFIAKEMSGYATLEASKIAAGTKFEVENSYDVFITIYSLEEIKISAQLTAWKDGGDVDVDIENDETTYSPTTTQP